MAKGKASQKTLGSEKDLSNARGNGAVFLIAALDMSWRVAIAVLVPIIGGFELDQHLNTTPALTIVGFLLAMAGLFLILKSTLASADERFRTKENHR